MDEQTKIPNCIESTTIEAFRKGLDPLSGLYTMILDYEPQTFDEVLALANLEIKLDENPTQISAFKRKPFDKLDTRGLKRAKGKFDP